MSPEMPASRRDEVNSWAEDSSHAAWIFMGFLFWGFFYLKIPSPLISESGMNLQNNNPLVKHPRRQ